jgi:low temperature requirement protein LtrA
MNGMNRSELYFDLILTSVLARLGEALRRGSVEDVDSATNVRPFGLLEYCLFFAIIWIFWQSLIRYNNGFYNGII